jgi:hypothetical protein
MYSREEREMAISHRSLRQLEIREEEDKIRGEKQG